MNKGSRLNKESGVSNEQGVPALCFVSGRIPCVRDATKLLPKLRTALNILEGTHDKSNHQIFRFHPKN